MMRILVLLACSFSVLVFAQKKKKYFDDVVSNADAKIILLKPVGNNHLSKDYSTFFGFGFGGNLMTPINFGIGLDYNVLFSNVKYGNENMAGSIGSPVLTIADLFISHRDKLSEDFQVEEMIGFSFYSHTNLFNYQKNQKYKNTGNGLNLGGRIIYNLDMEGYQQVFLAGKINLYYTNVFNENKEIQKYYDRSVFLSLGLGYRYNF